VGKSAWAHGVLRCRARICPVCWIGRRAKLASEIAAVVEARRAQTCTTPTLLTLTIRHSAQDPVEIVHQVRKAWQRMQRTRSWRAWSKRIGLEWIAAEEITRGQNGWHPHMHVLLLPRLEVLPGEHARLYDSWSKAVATVIDNEHVPLPMGVDVRSCTASLYLTKLGLELADPNVVKGRSPLALLADGRVDEYMELQRSRHRARDITWSRGLRPLRDAAKTSCDIEILGSLWGTEWDRLRHAAERLYREGRAPSPDAVILDVLDAAGNASPGQLATVLRSYLGTLYADDPPEAPTGLLREPLVCDSDRGGLNHGDKEGMRLQGADDNRAAT